MQVTQAGDNYSRRLRVKEELIKFRTPPNFKNMKKIWINRSSTETTTQTKHASPTPAPDLEKLERKEVIKPVVLSSLSAVKEVQPPLPPYPPPPNSPPNLNMVIKQEKEDVEGNFGAADVNSEPVSKPLAEKPREHNTGQPKRTICKEYIRRNCTRPFCKFAHKVDVSQLSGVYTFCWDHQNSVCTFPNCKYVHASFSEETEFYRSGVLPPHVQVQLKRKQARPLARTSQVEETLHEMRPNFANPPPSIHPGADKAMPVISCVPTSAIEQRPEDFRAPLPRSSSPLKREWGEIHEFSRSPRDLDCEHLAKKCKNCEIMEFSLKCNKNIVENLIESSEEIDKKIGQLNKKSTKLFHVIATLLKSAGKTPLSNGLLNGADKEKSLVEHLTNIVGANNRLSSAMNDDNIKNMIGGNNMNMTSLMAKLLYSPGEQALPQDSSRDT